MTEAAVILEVRHVRLAEHATLKPAALGPAAEGGEPEQGVFVALDDPPPVRTVLTVVEGEQRRALEVAWVVEVTERDATRGFYGRWVGDQAQERAAKVGTEHLDDGTPVVQPVVYDHSAALDTSDVMAMPAPVMLVDDDTGVVDVSDPDEDDEGEPDGAAETAEAAATPDEAGAEAVEGATEAVEAGAEAVEGATEAVETASEAVETAPEAVETAPEAVETASEAVEVTSESGEAEAVSDEEGEGEVSGEEPAVEPDAAPTPAAEGDADGSGSRPRKKKRSRRRR